MIEGAIKELAKRIAQLGFISKSGALAQVSNTTAGTGTGSFVMAQVYPFDKPGMAYVSPDKSETGIAFWQCGPTKVTRQDGYLNACENDLTLTVWVNGDRVKNGSQSAFSAEIYAALNRFRIPVEDGSPVRMAEITPNGDTLGDRVQGFGWEALTLKYDELPHVLFQVKFKLFTLVSSGCQTQTYQVINAAC